MDHTAAVTHARQMVLTICQIDLAPEVLETAVVAYLSKRQQLFPRDTRKAVTPKQRELLGFIKSYLAENEGCSPSFDEMQAFAGLGSKSGIHRLVTALEERGHIERLPNKARSIVVIEEAA